jgi:hypothetical protein
MQVLALSAEAALLVPRMHRDLLPPVVEDPDQPGIPADLRASYLGATEAGWEPRLYAAALAAVRQMSSASVESPNRSSAWPMRPEFYETGEMCGDNRCMYVGFNTLQHRDAPLDLSWHR